MLGMILGPDEGTTVWCLHRYCLNPAKATPCQDGGPRWQRLNHIQVRAQCVETRWSAVHQPMRPPSCRWTYVPGNSKCAPLRIAPNNSSQSDRGELNTPATYPYRPFLRKSSSGKI